MYAVLVGAAQDVVVGDGERVDAAARCLQLAQRLERLQVPDLT